MTRWLLSICLLALSALAQGPITTKTAGLQKQDGFFPIYWDAKAGKVWLVIDRFDSDLLYYESLPSGVGSNDTGLDRGLLGQEKVVQFTRSGPKLLMQQRNLDYRADSPDPAERRAVQESFATSVLWGFDIAAEEDGKVLVDATAFMVRDAMNVASRLRQQSQGTFRLDAARSAVYMPRTKSFPKNTELEATLTFAGEGVGNNVSSVTPTADSLTVRVHHSFLELPPPGYKPRAYDPRSGYIQLRYMDFSSPIEKPMVKRYILRHRLEKKDPTAKTSEAVKPLVYYVDRGTPEPVRTALLDGARWWNQAFEAIGYKDAFQVEIMPEGADPMDARYNIIQWVHRSTRGWSYGSSVSDPRTGEIIKGHVTLGSDRMRQDFMIAEGLLAPYESNDVSTKRLTDMVLSRLRQLSIHEVGHTLGLVHNFSASAFGRTSVMDYPHPLITMKADGSIDLADSYAVGAGEWDKVTIEYGYQDFPSGANEAAELRKVLDRAHQRGMYLISDVDSRALGGSHPTGHLWDNGANAVDELNRMMKVRAKALETFGEKVIPLGTPFSELENRLVPIYLSHRYQAEAVAKVVGGLDYRYALRGDGQMIAEMISPEEQRRALASLINTIRPETLLLPERLLKIMPPPALGFGRSRESFRGRTGLTFDAMAPVESAANMVIGLLLHPDRASRIVQQFARDPKNPSLEEIIDSLLKAAPPSTDKKGLLALANYTVFQSTLYHLMALASDQRAFHGARAIAYDKLMQLKKIPHTLMQAEIKRFEEDPKQLPLPRPAEPPPGMPFGDEAWPIF